MKTPVLSLMLAFAVIGGAVTVFALSANAVVAGPCDTSNPPVGCRLGTHNANTPPDKPPPACVATYFPPLPPGTTVGDHQVGMYDSPPARIELHGDSNGHAINYYMLINGKRIWEPGDPVAYRLPAAAAKCLAAKNMPKPQCRRSADPSMAEFCVADCQGEGLMVVVARAGYQRIALLYLKRTPQMTNSTYFSWGLCSAAAF
jgi:hypothetical protein